MRWFLRARFSHADAVTIGAAVGVGQQFGMAAGFSVAVAGVVAVVWAERRWR